LIWLVGESPSNITIAFAGAGGLILGIVVVVTNGVVWWANVILFALAFDLAAGFISNLSHSTKSFWSSQSVFLRASYVFAHVTVYPLAVWALVSSSALGGLLTLVLAAKILAFVINGFRKWPSRAAAQSSNPPFSASNSLDLENQ
jgi:hypothetical protein